MIFIRGRCHTCTFRGEPVRRLHVLTAVLAFFVLMAGTALAETYVEGYLGNNFTVTAPNPLELSINPAYRGPTKTVLEYPRAASSAITGGFKIGTWFSNTGWPHVDYPDWMKYLGFYLDLNYQQFYFLRSVGSRRMDITPSPGYLHYQHYKLLGNGNIYNMGFMFAFRYGFRPTKNVPFGKIQPYAAVGPALFITGIAPSLMFQPNDQYTLFPIYFKMPRTFSTAYQSILSLGLETELGVRFMITKFLSLDTSFKYRYTRPSATYDLFIDGFKHELTFAPQLNLFSVEAGVAYHF
jgi:hypothetical protein